MYLCICVFVCVRKCEEGRRMDRGQLMVITITAFHSHTHSFRFIILR